MAEEQPHAPLVTPGRWLAAMIAFFLLIGAAVFVADMFHIGGLGRDLRVPLWLQIYHYGELMDFTLWAVLAAATLVGGHLSGRLSVAGERRLAAFWIVLAAALLLMLINAAGTPVHFFGAIAERVLGIPALVARAAIRVGIVLVVVYALARYGRDAWAFRPARAYLVLAVLVHVLAVAMSLTGWKWYGVVGARLDLWLFRHRLPRDDTPGVIHEMQIMEVIVEQSMVLLAAALFLSLALAFRRHPRAVRPAS